jgi:putative DNA primase/helicase
MGQRRTRGRPDKKDFTSDFEMVYGEWMDAYLSSFNWNGLRTLWWFQGAFWLWREERPWYTRIAQDQMWSWVMRWLISQSLSSNPKTADDCTRVLSALATLYGVDRMPAWLGEENYDKPARHVSLSNGIIDPEVACQDPENAKLIGHSPNWFSAVSLPYPYNPEATNQTLLTWLQKRLDDSSKRDLLQEWAGYLVTPDTSKEVCLLLCGHSGTGKSTICRVIRDIIGQQNVANVALSQFGDHFVLPLLEGKALNWSDEVSTRMPPAAEERFKMIVSANPISVRGIYEPYRMVTPTARIMASTNDWPQFRDSGIWRRLLVIPATDVIPRENFDPHVEDSIRENLSGSFNWALGGLRRLREQGYFTRCVAGEKVLEDNRSEIENYKLFVSEQLEAGDAEQFLTGDELYRTYLTWCKGGGYKPVVTQRGLKKYILQTMPTVQECRKSYGRGLSGLWWSHRKGSQCSTSKMESTNTTSRSRTRGNRRRARSPQ